MKHIWNKYLRNVLAVGFLLVFATYYTNVSLFTHTHIINGVTIVHSHLHSPSHHSSQDGGHTTNQVTLIAHLTSQLLSCVCSVNNLLIVQQPFIGKIGACQEDKKSNLQTNYFSLRAPPVYC